MSLYNYITLEDVKTIYPSFDGVLEDLKLNQAETDIENALPNFFEGSFRPFMVGGKTITGTFAGDQFTTTELSVSTINLYSSCVLLDLATGVEYSIAGNTANTIFLSIDTGLNETKTVKIYQKAKLPFYRDVTIVNDECFKIINFKVKQAIVWQYLFLTNPELVPSSGGISSYNVNGASLSVTLDKSDRKYSNLNSQSLQILKDGGLLSQSLT